MNEESEAPTISLVFLTWNAEDCLPDTLDSVESQTYDDYEIVIVDNASDDSTVEIVKEYKERLPIRLLENDENLGFTAGTNRGIRASTGEYICCYNHDTIFPEDYLETLERYVSPDAVWTTARENHRVSRDHRTVRLLDWQRYAVPYVVDSLSGKAQVNFVPGDGVIIPRAIYEEQLDRTVFDLPGKGEDVDLSLRLRDKGIPMFAILDTYSIHPDTGIYNPSMENLKEHLVHAQMRFIAYWRNNHTASDLASILLSVFTIPLTIYVLRFPRESSEFEKSVNNK
jgi:GT2 family glycosyltransferase